MLEAQEEETPPVRWSWLVLLAGLFACLGNLFGLLTAATMAHHQYKRGLEEMREQVTRDIETIADGSRRL